MNESENSKPIIVRLSEFKQQRYELIEKVDRCLDFIRLMIAEGKDQEYISSTINVFLRIWPLIPGDTRNSASSLQFGENSGQHEGNEGKRTASFGNK